MQLGEAIRSLRGAAGLSQQQLADDLEISPSYLSLVESNKREPTVTLVRRIAARLGAPASLLFAAALAGSHDSPEHRYEREAVESLLAAARHLVTINRFEAAGPTAKRKR